MDDGASSPASTGNAWKPPPAAGTVSLSRAQRWQSAGSPSSSSAPSGLGGSPLGSSGTVKPGLSPGSWSRGSVKRGSEAAALRKPVVYPEISEEFFSEWYTKLEHPEAGKLRSQSTQGPKHGMSHPPQNREIRKELAHYIQSYGLVSHLEPRPVARGPKPAVAASDVATSDGGSPIASSLSSPTHVASRGRSLASPKGEFGRTAVDASPGARRSSRKSGGGGQRKAVGVEEEVPSWMQGGKDKHVPPPTTDIEVRRWTRELSSQSKEHGFVLAKADAYDLAQLNMYHNAISRSSSPPPKNRHAASIQKLRDYATAVKGGVVEAAPTTSATPPRERPAVPAPASTWSGPGSWTSPPRGLKKAGSSMTLDQWSPTKMLILAEKMKSAGPCRLDTWARQTGVHMLTGNRS